ncbi:Uncharacterized protein APZ42_010642, partial [Daphnia magna]
HAHHQEQLRPFQRIRWSYGVGYQFGRLPWRLRSRNEPPVDSHFTYRRGLINYLTLLNDSNHENRKQIA